MNRFVFVSIVTASLCVPATAQVTTQHNDISRTGLNDSETILTPGNVNSGHFGKLASAPVDGFIAGQPLYLPTVSLPDGSTHNIVFVATMHDSVYALDAKNGAVLWTRSLLPPHASTVPISMEGCPATGFTEVGVLGTPVIDTASGTLYVVAKTLEGTAIRFRLYALDIASGRDRTAATSITGMVATSAGIKTFNPAKHHQRPGLLLSNGKVYVAFGSNGCDYYANGWIMAYDSASLQQTAVINTDGDQSFGGSIWQSGKGLAADSAGNLFFATANGPLDPNNQDYGDSVVRLTGSLTPSDYFSPYIHSILDADDYDLGSGGVILLPDQPYSTTHLLVAAGKEGTVYLLDRDDMGQFRPDQDSVVQTIPGGLPTVLGGGTGAAYWNNNIYYSTARGMRVFSLNNGMITPVNIPSATSNASGKGLPSISANGLANGVLWALRGVNYSKPFLAAYDALAMSPLYSSATNPRDAVGPIAHFATPTIADGRVYLGTQSQLLIYGLLPHSKPRMRDGADTP